MSILLGLAIGLWLGIIPVVWFVSECQRGVGAAFGWYSRWSPLDILAVIFWPVTLVVVVIHELCVFLHDKRKDTP